MGILLEQINVKVRIWQGENDTSIPMSQAYYYGGNDAQLPGVIHSQRRHLWSIDHTSEVLETLVPGQPWRIG